jgi:hypothetical protein
MAKPNHTREIPAASNSRPGASAPTGQCAHRDRFLRVEPLPEYNPRSSKSLIRLRGIWLAQAGFAPQARVRVRVMHGCLIITTEDESS